MPSTMMGGGLWRSRSFWVDVGEAEEDAKLSMQHLFIKCTIKNQIASHDEAPEIENGDDADGSNQRMKATVRKPRSDTIVDGLK